MEYRPFGATNKQTSVLGPGCRKILGGRRCVEPPGVARAVRRAIAVREALAASHDKLPPPLAPRWTLDRGRAAAAPQRPTR